MNKNPIRAILLSGVILFCGCGTSPIKATYLSDQKNIWVSDLESGLFYCVADHDSAKEINPVCFPAHRYNSKDLPVKPYSSIEAPSGFREAKEPKETRDSNGS